MVIKWGYRISTLFEMHSKHKLLAYEHNVSPKFHGKTRNFATVRTPAVGLEQFFACVGSFFQDRFEYLMCNYAYVYCNTKPEYGYQEKCRAQTCCHGILFWFNHMKNIGAQESRSSDAYIEYEDCKKDQKQSSSSRNTIPDRTFFTHKRQKTSGRSCDPTQGQCCIKIQHGKAWQVKYNPGQQIYDDCTRNRINEIPESRFIHAPYSLFNRFPIPHISAIPEQLQRAQ